MSKDLIVREFTSLDYPIFADWLRSWGEPVVPLKWLPMTGFIVGSVSEDIVIGFMYKTDSPVVLIDSIVSNIKSDKVLRGQALDELFETFLKVSRRLGFELIIAHTKIEKHIKRCLKFGAECNTQNVSLVTRRL